MFSGRDVEKHWCRMTTVASRTIRGKTVNTRRCSICGRTIER